MSEKKLLELSFPKGKRIGVFAMLVACFALWGLLNNMTDNLVPAFQKIFTMDQSRAGLIQVAFYGAYAVLAIFASILVEEFSYRVGVLIGLAVPGRKKRPAAWAASLVFVAAYVPLMGKFLPYLLGDRVAIEDIYR